MTKPFRFGVVTPLLGELRTWQDEVRRIADSGYSTVLMPDVPHMQPSPGPTLAVAATLADVRVGTWVSASPFRRPWSLAWEAHSLSTLTDGRFELGLGAGRPGIEDELRRLGIPNASPGRRVELMREIALALRELDGPDHHTPIAMAVRGPKSRAVAAELADTINFATTPEQPRSELDEAIRETRAATDAELALHISVVGERVAPLMGPPWLKPAELPRDSLIMLPGDTGAAVAELQKRRDECGFSYVVIGANSAAAFAPVVAELAGR